MDDTTRSSDDTMSNAAYASAADAKELRRKLKFWRSAAWTILGLAAVVVVVVYQRAETRREQSRLALEQYAQSALDAGLSKEPPELIELQWQRLPSCSPAFGPGSYIPVVQNWLRTPEKGKLLPMAISRSPLSVLFSTGRHVLYRDENGFRVEWVSEQDAAPILERISRQP